MKTTAMKAALVAAVLSLLPTTAVKAQSEGGLLLGAELDKKLTRQLSVSVEGEFRTRNDFKTIDRWSGSVGASYKFTKWLKADAGYSLLYGNNREKISYNTDGSYNNWRPSYWSTRHRLNASLTADYKFSNNLHLSLRERWQYTYRPESTPTRWDFDNAKWEDKLRKGKGKNQLRSRLQVEYDKKGATLKPYANVELYHSPGIEKLRYSVGADVKLTKRHSLDIYYRFQDQRNVDESDYDPDMHYLGVGYKFKF